MITTHSPRVAVVTGAGAGIGRACALRFGREGYGVLAVDRAADDLAASADQLRAAGVDCLTVVADVSEAPACDAFAAAALERWGRIDVLVANAGVQTGGSLADADADWNRILEVNVKGVARSCAAVLPAMRARGGGAIVMVSSINAVIGVRGMAIYDASKAGVLGMMRSLAVEHGDRGIRVNAVCPGATVTDFHERRAAARGITPAQLRDRTRGYGLLGRAAEPAEQAAVIYFLASDEAAFITGQAIVADGGYSLTAGSN
ncbi:MAG: SDR family oxidoreductase [Gammaproteobacteria bacterium]|nr:SDR family oxidoreductase [Gammaproteobacteria bacterium]